jgi:hypothetical protein
VEASLDGVGNFVVAVGEAISLLEEDLVVTLDEDGAGEVVAGDVRAEVSVDGGVWGRSLGSRC